MESEGDSLQNIFPHVFPSGIELEALYMSIEIIHSPPWEIYTPALYNVNFSRQVHFSFEACMKEVFKVYLKDLARPYNEILTSCFVNYSSSFSPTANYSFKGFIHLKTTVPFFLTTLRCPLPFWSTSPAIRVSQPILAEKENDRWFMFTFQRGE